MNLGSKNKLDNKDSVGKITGFFLFRNVINGYNCDKEKPEEERKNIKTYGKLSVTLSIIALLISGCCLIANLMELDVIGFSYVLMLIIYIFSGIIISILLAIYGFVFGVMQCRLNRKSIGIIGIVLSVLAIICSLFLVIVMIV
jgi:hypothetical protein